MIWRQVLGLVLPLMVAVDKITSPVFLRRCPLKVTCRSHTYTPDDFWVPWSGNGRGGLVHEKLLWAHQPLCWFEPKEVSFYGNICSMVLVNHIAAGSLNFFLIKVYSQRYLNNYKIQLIGHKVSKWNTSQGQAVSKGDYPTPNAIWVTAIDPPPGIKIMQMNVQKQSSLWKQSDESVWAFTVGASCGQKEK